MKVSEAQRRQGSDQHWCREVWLGPACGSHLGGSTTDRSRVTCERCLRGERAEDTVTGPYGKPYVQPPPPEDENGQLELLA